MSDNNDRELGRIVLNFDFDKIKRKVEGEGNQWASYSDLFMVLSVVFLLLYVTASLRTGTISVKSHYELEEARQKVQNIKSQIQVYESLKNQYLQEQATEGEEKTYKELMSKLTLLRDEAKDEKEQLRKKASENEKKEHALNEYQQMVRNIINAQLVAKARIIKRNETIDRKQKEIEVLDDVVAQKETQINQNNRQIARTEAELSRNIEQLKKTYRAKKIQKSTYEKQLQKLQDKSEQKISKLNQKSRSYLSELTEAKSQLTEVSQELVSKNQELKQKKQKTSELLSKLQNIEAINQEKVEKVQRELNTKLIAETQRYKKQLKAEKLSAVQKLAKEKEHREKLKELNKKYNEQVGSLNEQITATKQQIGAAKAEKKQAVKQLAAFKASSAKELAELESDLEKSQANVVKTKRLAKAIAKNFKKSGVKASVNEKNGDVTIQFGKEYFDTGKANLKSNMKTILMKLVPVYAKSLLADPEIAKEIDAVEIVGFASPTYRGKFVDPHSLKARDKKAINYNLDLSLSRAKSTFSYIFDPKKFSYDYQKDLLKLVKVSGRSYFASENPSRSLANKSSKDFCDKYDCKGAQRVLIKFKLKN